MKEENGNKGAYQRIHKGQPVYKTDSKTDMSNNSARSAGKGVLLSKLLIY